MQEEEETEGTERKQEKLGLRGGRKTGPLRMGNSECWRGCRGGTVGTGGAAEVAKARLHWCIQCAQ